MQAFFDLEGPLSPQDNAYEVSGLIRNGYKIFEIISRYDDILTLESRAGYEPGDTLKLIVPFLVYHNITDNDIKSVSEKAKIVQGAKRLISELKTDNWNVYIISTSYIQHAMNIAEKLEVKPENVACTELYLEKFRGLEGIELVAEVEGRILEIPKKNGDDTIKEILDSFFFKEFQKTELGKAFNKIEVMGGTRKATVLREFLKRDGGEIKSSVAIGDSITDYKMLREVKQKGGLAIVFNGNSYSLPYGDIAVASESIYSLKPLFNAFSEGSKSKAVEIAGFKNNMKYDVIGKSIHNDLLEIHSKHRKLVRGEAWKLG